MHREITTTKDGSHSLYIPEMDEQYHSIHGSIKEAMKVYIEHGLIEKSKKKTQLRIFEMGLGSGLNALLSWQQSRKKGLKIEYHALEKYPLKREEWTKLNFSKELEISSDQFEQIHESEWGKKHQLDDHFSLLKLKGDLKDWELQSKYDLIFYDAFAPEKQENLWTEPIFEKLYNGLTTGGILTTYCVKGEVRRKLKNVGFQIEKLPGPEGGKREVLRARKNYE